MKQIPILFKPEMVEAILNDLKTQTRRVIHGQPFVHPDHVAVLGSVIAFATEKNFNNIAYCPYGNPGDVLWVREAWQKRNEKALLMGFDKYFHKAGHKYCNDAGWKPSIHMPKEACRLFLENKNVRVQRISEISDEDCIAEGIKLVYDEDLESGNMFTSGKWYRNYGKSGPSFLKPRESFISLWQSINGVPKPIQEVIDGKLKTIGYIVCPFNEEYAEPFSGLTKWRGKPLTVVTNPWVWVIDFERMEGGVK